MLLDAVIVDWIVGKEQITPWGIYILGTISDTSGVKWIMLEKRLDRKLMEVEGAKHAIPLYILYRFWNTVFVIIKFCKDCVLHIPVEYQEEYSAKHLLPINGS